MRYVGDMLAWVHQAIAAEREFLESLFGIKNDGRMVGSVRVFEGQSEEEDWVQELMDLAVGKLCVPLKVGFVWIEGVVRLLTLISLSFFFFLEFEGQSAADGTVAGKQYCFLQDCEPLAVLLGYYAEDRWVAGDSHCDLGRVRPSYLTH